MKTTHLQAALLLSCLTGIGTAQASLIVPGEGTVSLAPASPTVGSGLAFTVDVILDATGSGGDIPGAYDGEFVIDFDPLQIRYDAFVLAPGVSFFSGPAIATSGGRQTITVGFADGNGNGSIGQFAFTALATPGTVAVIGLADADDFLGTFVSNQPSYQPFYPTFLGTQVGIIPVPAAGLLLGSALAGLGLRRRARVASSAT
jgi:hypothetical protein